MKQKPAYFLFGEEQKNSLKNAKFVVLPVPMERTVSYMKGTMMGPREIIRASAQVEFFDCELGFDCSKSGIYTDWTLGENEKAFNEPPIEHVLTQITTHVRNLVQTGHTVISLGGEHTILPALMPPFIEKWGKDLTVVHFDAHADLKDTYEDTPWSHACAVRRILGQVPIVSMGIRSVDEEEYALGKSHPGIQLFYAHEIHKNPAWIADVLSHIKTKYVYVTFDLDGLDPSVIPGLGTPEPGGLTWNQATNVLFEIAKKHFIVGADINEIAPSPLEYANFNAAKLTYKIMGYAALSQR